MITKIHCGIGRIGRSFMRLAIAFFLFSFGSLRVTAEGDGEEILQNGNFAETVLFEKPVAKWDVVGKKLPRFWSPVYSYGNAHAEVTQVQNEKGEDAWQLQLTAGALLQELLIKPSSVERILNISFDLSGNSSIAIRVNRKDVFNISKREMPKTMRHFEGQATIKPGETIRNFSIWSPGEIRIANLSARLEGRVEEAAATSQTIEIPAGVITVETQLQIGTDGLKLTLCFQNGSEKQMSFYPFSLILPANLKTGEAKDTDKTTEKIFLTKVLPDAGIVVNGLSYELRRYVRPNLKTLKESAQNELVAKWDTFTSAREYRFPLTFQMNGEQLECWIDHQYAGSIPAGDGLKSLVFTCPESSRVEETVFDSKPISQDFLPLDLARMDQPGKMQDAKLEITDDKLFKKIPFMQPTSANLDLGVTAQQSRLFANSAYGYMWRSPFDNSESTFLFSVPVEQYIRAWVLCAAENDPAKDRMITARLTRFTPDGGSWAGRGRDSLADTTIELPGDNNSPAENIRQVGTVTVKGESLPLWLVEIPLKSSDIQDIIFDDKGPKTQGERLRPTLDFELLGSLTYWAHPFTDARHFPLPSATSGVHVFGITLEKPSVEMEVRQNQPGNIFHNDEIPELPVALRARQPGKYVLSWSIHDVDGKQVGTGSDEMTLKPGEGERIVTVSLAQPELGWYEIAFELKKENRVLLIHTASFALLGPDTRQAGFESPFSSGQWPWHYCPKDPQINGALALKAGFRRLGSADRTLGNKEADCAPWKCTIVCGPLTWRNALKKTEEEVIKHISNVLENWPHATHTMIFYESTQGFSPYAIAPELIGLKQTPEAEDPGSQQRYEKAMWFAKIVRENFPQLKILVGNSLGSSELVAQLLRRGFPEEYADYVGVETVGRTGQPEKLWAGGFQAGWLMREVARKYGYHKWGVSCCQEVNYRHDRLLGQRRQAEWYVRDMMLAFAYRSPLVHLGELYDAGNCYNSSFWGAMAFCRRYPFMYPKKSYVAVATATRVLDRVKFIREMPTPSNSLYALEFSRPDGKNIYVIWAGRGTAEVTLEFNNNADIELIDLYGRLKKKSTKAKRLDITAQSAVQYMVTASKLDKISVGKRAYPDDIIPENIQVIASMDKIDDWQLINGEDSMLEETKRPHLPYRTAGKFSMRQVKDDEKGDCLEVELHPQTNLPEIMNEYTVIRLKKTVAVPDNATTLGLWVKGNSGWGYVYWEVEDAKGVRRVSCGTTVHGGDVFDYDAQLCTINFDGWNFLRMPITDKSPVPDLSTGSVPNLWQCKDASVRLSPPVYPLKVTGIVVSLPPKAMYLTEMRPIKQVIRLKNLSAYE